MNRERPIKPGEHDEEWRKTLTQGHPGLTAFRKAMRLLPGTPRCKVCHNPFGGFGGHLCRVVGMVPSRKNPQICALCCEKMPPGGAEVEIAVLFADVRGSTVLAERLGPTAFADTLNRFYRTATEVLVRYDATIDKLIGDEVMAFFVPGFAGPEFKRSAIEAGQALLHALGYGGKGEPWISVGIGVDAGVAFVGNVGSKGYVDFTALGDPVNMAARMRTEARAGELLVGEAAYRAVADRYPGCAVRSIAVKGKQGLIDVRSLPLEANG
ncbi:MAG: adenylate/guanylate cyclase domain-containing protein [Alphaproteobacteria bacterium]